MAVKVDAGGEMSGSFKRGSFMRGKVNAGCCCFYLLVCLITVLTVLLAAYGFPTPVRVTVDDASLRRLALAEPAPDGSINGTAMAYSIAYDLSLAVALRNPNWAARAWLVAPVVTDVRFRGLPFAALGLLGRHRIGARRREVYRASTAAKSVAVALGSDGVAEFVRASAAGVFQLEVVVYGEVKYQGGEYSHEFRASCPVKLSVSSTAAFERVECNCKQA